MRGETPATTFALSLKMALDKPYSGGDRNAPVLSIGSHWAGQDWPGSGHSMKRRLLSDLGFFVSTVEDLPWR